MGSVLPVFCRKETIEEYVKKVKEEHTTLQKSDRDSQEHRLMCSGFGHWIPGKLQEMLLALRKIREKAELAENHESEESAKEEEKIEDDFFMEE